MPTMKFRTAILRLKAIDINLNYCYTSIIFSVFFILIGVNFDLHQHSSYNHCTLKHEFTQCYDYFLHPCIAIKLNHIPKKVQSRITSLS